MVWLEEKFGAEILAGFPTTTSYASGPVGKGWQIALLLLLAVDGLLVFRWTRTRSERSQDDLIVAAAYRYRVHPALVKAVVWQESRFNRHARGKAGEIGLMQIRSLAAQEWAQAEHLTPFTHEHLADPGTNTLAGAWYLKKMLRRYRQTDNPLAYALADYNAGRKNVLRWNQGTAATNSEVFLDHIDFPGTREYIDSVSDRFHQYIPEFPIRTASR